ncbi:MAG TPA: TfoX/Sxy family protein [Methanomassiliicoccales archaeon]|nr:TfoX/Sxy family protein [Methanomassiliicoccales archaeon]
MPSMKGTAWPKASAEKGELLEAHLKRFKADKRQMFGAPVWFVNGNMFAGVFADGIFARFSEKDRTELKNEARPFEPVAGHAMSEYLTLSIRIDGDGAELDRVLDLSYRYVSSLKPKKKGK